MVVFSSRTKELTTGKENSREFRFFDLINKNENVLKEAKTDLSALSAKQQEAVESEEKRILVLAGAGSGKTKTLLQKIIYLIEEKGVSPSSILAVTFTKKCN